MALTRSLPVFDAGAHSARPLSRNNVIPFPSSRVLLPVTLHRTTDDQLRGQLRQLLHSPLGVYVVSTQTVRDGVCVQFGIALDDLDFTLHTLIATLPQATIGQAQRRNSSKETH